MAGSQTGDRRFNFGSRLPRHPTHRLYLLLSFAFLLTLFGCGLAAAGAYHGAAEIGGMGLGGGLVLTGRLFKRKEVESWSWYQLGGWLILAPVLVWNAIQLVDSLVS